LTRVSSLV